MNDFEPTEVEATITVDKNYLRDLITEIVNEYEGEFAAPIEFRSEALRTLWYLATEE